MSPKRILRKDNAMKRWGVLSLVLSAALSLSACGFEPFARIPFRLSFSGPLSVATAAGPTELLGADFDGDGHLDLVVVYAAADRVELYRGDGAGGFQAEPALSTLPRPRRARLADFNRDGLPDVVVLEDTSRRLSVLLGDPAAGLVSGPSVELPAGRSLPLDVALGDFDGDGSWDWALSFKAGSQGLVLYGDGEETETTWPVSEARFLSADLDADGRGDLLVYGRASGATGGGDEAGGGLFLLAGTQTGLGEPQTRFEATRGSLRAVTLADLDGDGAQDVLAGLGATALLFLPRAQGTTFADPLKFVVPSIDALAAFDLDLDGDVDVIASESRNEAAPGRVRVLLNAGGARLREPVTFEVGFGPQSLVVGDFDENGFPDVAVLSVLSERIDLLFNQGPP